MGVILVGACPCGYTTPELLEGCGFGGPASCRALVSCPRCRAIRSVPTNGRSLQCPRCRGSAAPLELDEANDEPWSDQPWPCPRCEQVALRFEPLGLWD